MVGGLQGMGLESLLDGPKQTLKISSSENSVANRFRTGMGSRNAEFSLKKTPESRSSQLSSSVSCSAKEWKRGSVGTRFCCPSSSSSASSLFHFSSGSDPDEKASFSSQVWYHSDGHSRPLPLHFSTNPIKVVCFATKKPKVGAGKLMVNKNKRENKSQENFEWEKMMSLLLSARNKKGVREALDNYNRKINFTKQTTIGTINRLRQLKKWRALIDMLVWLQDQSWWSMSSKDYTLLILSYAKAGETQKALETFDTFIKDGLTPDVYVFTAALEAYVSGHMFERAETLIQEMIMSNLKPSILTYQILLRGYCEQNHVEDATRLFEKLKSGSTPDVEPDVQIFNTMIHMYAENGRFEDASRIFRQIKSFGLSPNLVTFNIMIAMFAKEARSREAESVFRQMQEMGMSPDVSTYTALLTSYGRAGRAEEAQSVFQDIISANLRPSLFAYNALLDAYGKAGQVENAEYVFKEMIRNKYKPSEETYTCLMDAYVKDGRMEKAEAVLRTYVKENKNPNVAIWHVLIDGYRLSGDVENAENRFEEMKSFGIKPNHQVYTTLIDMYGNEDDFDRALNVYEEMKKRGVAPDEGVRKALMKACKDDNQKEKALSVIGEWKQEEKEVGLRIWKREGLLDKEESGLENVEDVSSLA